MSKLCGEDLSSFVGRDSPFTRIVFIHYDDGPTSGAVQCSSNSETYRFEMLARDHDGIYDRQAWDQGAEIRIFSLAPLPAVAFERLANALSNDETRRKIAEEEIYFNEVYSILDEADPPESVIATHGISSKIIAGSQISSDDIAGVQDWFSFLGLTAST